jgi:hypothetical protein
MSIKKINQQTVEELKKSVEELEKKIKEQKELYELNLKDYGSIVNYRKEIFGEDGKSGIKSQIIEIQNKTNEIKERIDEFDLFWNGDEDNLSFNDCKEKIISIHTKADDLLNKISDSETSIINQNKTIIDFTEKYQNTLNKKLEEVETVKKDLQDYRDQVVGGSLFKTYKEKAFWSNITSLVYSGIGISLLLCAGGILLWLLLKVDRQNTDSFISSSISFILFTASFICSGNSKTFRKLTEEYAHKATLLQSFVGYREQYKQTLDDEEYSQFFKEVIEAVKINPSERIDKLLHFKWPFEKAIDTVNSGFTDTCKIISKSTQKKQDATD